MYQDLTKGKIGKTLILFALPMMAGNFLQQFYNIADTLIVGRVLGRNALAAVGSAYTLMTFLTSIFLGFSMGAGALFSIYYGKGDKKALSEAITQGFLLNMGVTIVVNVMVYMLLEKLLVWLQIPAEVMDGMRQYLLIIFAGLIASSVYNFFACMLRALGNSLVPLVFLGVSTVLNVGLDILFVIGFKAGISGAAYATILSQYLSAIGICIYVAIACRDLSTVSEQLRWRHLRQRSRLIRLHIFQWKILAMRTRRLLHRISAQKLGSVSKKAQSRHLQSVFYLLRLCHLLCAFLHNRSCRFLSVHRRRM